MNQSIKLFKNYVSVYTCAVSRAVHLDTVPDLTAEAFIRNFRQFAAHCGLPHELNSDNWKTFVCLQDVKRPVQFTYSKKTSCQ